MRFFTVFIALIISVSIFGNSQTPFAFIKSSLVLSPPITVNTKCYSMSAGQNDITACGAYGTGSASITEGVDPGFGYFSQTTTNLLYFNCPTITANSTSTAVSQYSSYGFIPAGNIIWDLTSGGPVYSQLISSTKYKAFFEDSTDRLFYTNGSLTPNYLSGTCTQITSTPSITSISPTSGTTANGSGTSVTVYGNNFRAGSTVSIGGTTCTSPTVNLNQITCTTGAHAQGLTSVVVSDSTTSATLSNAYTYNVANVAVSDDCGTGIADNSTSNYFRNIAPISEYGKSFTANEDILATGGGNWSCIYNRRIYCPSLPAVTARAVNYTSYILSGGSWIYKIISPPGTLHYSLNSDSRIIHFNGVTGVLYDYEGGTYGSCTIVP